MVNLSENKSVAVAVLLMGDNGSWSSWAWWEGGVELLMMIVWVDDGQQGKF